MFGREELEVRKSFSSWDSEAKEYRTRRCENARTASLFEIVTLVIAVWKSGIARDWWVLAVIMREGDLVGERWKRCRAERARMPWRRKDCCWAICGMWVSQRISVVEVEML